MIPPATAARWLAAACLMGAGLGLVYGFLRPLRKKRNWFWDLIFVAMVFWMWLQHSFGICEGDIRPVCTLAMLGSMVLWERSFGQYLKPLFFGFWETIGKLWRILRLPFALFYKKFLRFVKNIFANKNLRYHIGS